MLSIGFTIHTYLPYLLSIDNAHEHTYKQTHTYRRNSYTTGREYHHE